MTESEINSLVLSVAWWYARRVWWADVQDLIQEGWTTALECGAANKPSGYVWSCISKRLSRYCWEQSSPVSSSKANREKMQGLHRVTLEDFISQATEQTVDPEMEVIKAEAAMLVRGCRERLRERAREVSDSRDPFLGAALSVLLEGQKPRHVASCSGLSIYQVYDAVGRVKRAVVRDEEAAELLDQIRRLEHEE